MSENQSQDQEIDLTHYIEVVMRRRWILISALAIVFISTALVTFFTKPVYQASSLLVIEKERNAGGTIYTGGAMIESTNDDYYQTQYKLLQSESLTQKVYDEQGLAKEPDFAGAGGVSRFRRAISIVPVVRSRLVYVRVQSHEAKLAARGANAMAEAFVEENLANQMFISKDILQALKLSGDNSQARQTYESLPSVVGNPLIQNLKGERAKLEAQFAEMSQRFTPKHPAMIALKSNVAALTREIDTETDKIVQSLKTELSGQLRGNNVRIVDMAQIPQGPFKPKKTQALFLGLLGGLAVGLLLAFVVETIDQSIRTQEDVENKLDQPYLGLVPLSFQKDGSVYQSLLVKGSSLTSEAMRNLRTMIDFTGVSHKAKAILLTSSVQGEGKTYVGSNLAVVFAQLGETVLLIDGDLRRSNIHMTFKLPNQRGLSDFLAAGQDVGEIAAMLQETDVPNLKVLTGGVRPPNPSELLNTPRLGAVVAWAKANFDRVIVDCTPMFPINDTLLWGRHVPAAVFIVRYGKTRIPLVRNACRKLGAGGMNILGVALNSATHRGLTYASYGYYYYHSYYHAYHREASAGKTS